MWATGAWVEATWCAEIWVGMCRVCNSSYQQLPSSSSLFGCSDLLCRGWKHGEQAKTVSVEGVLNQTTSGSKSWTRGQLLGSNCHDSYFCVFILSCWSCQQQSV